MKKIKIISLSSITCLVLLGTNTLYAKDASDFDISLEIAKTKKVDRLVNRMSSISKYVEQYILLTGDLTPTVQEMNDYFGALNWKNYNGDSLEMEFIVASYTIKIKKPFSKTSSLSSMVQKSFENNVKVPTGKIDMTISDGLSSLVDPTVIGFIKKVQDAIGDINAVVSHEEPADTSKTWYKPDGNGNLIQRQFDTALGGWVNSGGDGSGSGEGSGDGSGTGSGSSGGDGVNRVTVESYSDLLNVPSPSLGMQGIVNDGAIATIYYYGHTGWAESSVSATLKKALVLYASILAISDKKYDELKGVRLKAKAPDGEYIDAQEFTKMSDDNGDYWLSDDGGFVVVKTLDILDNLTSQMDVGTIAWMHKGGNNLYKLKLNTLDGSSNGWEYIAGDYEEVAQHLSAPYAISSGNYVFSQEHKEHFFRDNSSMMLPVHPSKTRIAKDNRDQFNANEKGLYLLASHDCESDTCNGGSDTDYYAGVKIDNLYPFFYAETGLRKNSLTDAQSFENWNQFWEEEASTIIWMGNAYGDTEQGQVLLKASLNGEIAYKTKSGNYVNKIDGKYIPFNVLPTGTVSSNASIVTKNGINYITQSGLNGFMGDTTLPYSYPVFLDGDSINNTFLQKCSDLDETIVYSDKCDTIESASYAFTMGSRTDIGSTNNPSRLNLTKNIGDEERYTTNGVLYPSNTSWFQWFKATDDSLTDVYDANSVNPYFDTIAKSVGYAFKNGVTAKFNVHGKEMWTSLDNDRIYLDNNFNSISYKTAGNGLIYDYHADDNDIPEASLATGFGVTEWDNTNENYVNDNSNRTNICSIKGMRLPVMGETTALSDDGVYVGGKLSWTASPEPDGGDSDEYGVWKEYRSPSYKIYTKETIGVICVK